MGKLRDRYPPRGSDPLHGVRSYVDKRSGAPDSAKERRKARARARAPEVAGGEAGPQTLSGTAVWDPPSLITGDDAGTIVTVSGVANDATWVCAASFTQLASAGNDQWLISAWPQTANTVVVRILNVSGNTHDLASGTVAVRCWKVD